jgi:hypothetical protein
VQVNKNRDADSEDSEESELKSPSASGVGARDLFVYFHIFEVLDLLIPYSDFLMNRRRQFPTISNH